MKKKLLILSASIGLLLACFPFTLYAEEDPQSDLGVSSPAPNYYLDDYFYDNYVLLPYIESDARQYINTGIKPNYNTSVNIVFGFPIQQQNGKNILGVNGYRLSYSLSSAQEQVRFTFNNNGYTFMEDIDYYSMYTMKYDNFNLYFNNQLVHQFASNTYSSNYDMYVFSYNNDGTNQGNGVVKIYSFSIYDRSLNDGEGGYLRYFYPARSKSGDVIGLYDSISKTFFTSQTAYEFVQPVGSDAEMGISAKITSFIYSGLNWIGEILEFAITEPLIICFMAIGLAGAMFRWGRRLVHF